MHPLNNHNHISSRSQKYQNNNPILPATIINNANNQSHMQPNDIPYITPQRKNGNIPNTNTIETAHRSRIKSQCQQQNPNQIKFNKSRQKQQQYKTNKNIQKLTQQVYFIKNKLNNLQDQLNNKQQIIQQMNQTINSKFNKNVNNQLFINLSSKINNKNNNKNNNKKYNTHRAFKNQDQYQFNYQYIKKLQQQLSRKSQQFQQREQQYQQMQGYYQQKINALQDTIKKLQLSFQKIIFQKKCPSCSTVNYLSDKILQKTKQIKQISLQLNQQINYQVNRIKKAPSHWSHKNQQKNNNQDRQYNDKLKLSKQWKMLQQQLNKFLTMEKILINRYHQQSLKKQYKQYRLKFQSTKQKNQILQLQNTIFILKQKINQIKLQNVKLKDQIQSNKYQILLKDQNLIKIQQCYNQKINQFIYQIQLEKKSRQNLQRFIKDQNQQIIKKQKQYKEKQQKFMQILEGLFYENSKYKSKQIDNSNLDNKLIKQIKNTKQLRLQQNNQKQLFEQIKQIFKQLQLFDDNNFQSLPKSLLYSLQVIKQNLSEKKLKQIQINYKNILKLFDVDYNHKQHYNALINQINTFKHDIKILLDNINQLQNKNKYLDNFNTQLKQQLTIIKNKLIQSQCKYIDLQNYINKNNQKQIIKQIHSLNLKNSKILQKNSIQQIDLQK